LRQIAPRALDRGHLRPHVTIDHLLGSKQSMERKNVVHVWYWILAFLAVMWVHSVWTEMRTVEPLP
jgi:hypothetical protein